MDEFDASFYVDRRQNQFIFRSNSIRIIGIFAECEFQYIKNTVHYKIKRRIRDNYSFVKYYVNYKHHVWTSKIYHLMKNKEALNHYLLAWWTRTNKFNLRVYTSSFLTCVPVKCEVITHCLIMGENQIKFIMQSESHKTAYMDEPFDNHCPKTEVLSCGMSCRKALSNDEFL